MVSPQGSANSTHIMAHPHVLWPNSLLVFILIFTIFPDPLVSVMAFTQWTFSFQQFYNLYMIYNQMNIKRKYMSAEYMLRDDVR
jgi:hypothetical protein